MVKPVVKIYKESEGAWIVHNQETDYMVNIVMFKDRDVRTGKMKIFYRIDSGRGTLVSMIPTLTLAKEQAKRVVLQR